VLRKGIPGDLQWESMKRTGETTEKYSHGPPCETLARGIELMKKKKLTRDGKNLTGVIRQRAADVSPRRLKAVTHLQKTRPAKEMTDTWY